MILKYENFILKEETSCSICLSAILENDAVAHEGDGKKHPFHRSCAKTSSLISETCPFCREPIDETSLWDWKDKSIIELKAILKDSGLGIYSGATAVGVYHYSINRILAGSILTLSTLIEKNSNEIIPIIVGSALGGSTGLFLSNTVLASKICVKKENFFIAGTMLGAGLSGFLKRKYFC